MNDEKRIPMRPKWVSPVSTLILPVAILLLGMGVVPIVLMLFNPQFASFTNAFIAVFSLAAFRVLLKFNKLLLHDDAFWYRRHLRKRRCPYCLYDMRGLPQPRCPECGSEAKPR